MPSRYPEREFSADGGERNAALEWVAAAERAFFGTDSPLMQVLPQLRRTLLPSGERADAAVLDAVRTGYRELTKAFCRRTGASEVDIAKAVNQLE